MPPHTVKAYGDELNQLTAEVARMGGLAEAQVADSVDSVARRDVALARAVVDRGWTPCIATSNARPFA